MDNIITLSKRNQTNKQRLGPEQTKILLVFGYIREYQIKMNFIFPKDITQLLLSYCLEHFELLKLKKCANASNKNLILSNNDRCVTNNTNYLWTLFVIADIEPVIEGIHCWRIYTKILDMHNYNSITTLIMWMISKYKKNINNYKDMSFDDDACFGISFVEWFPRYTEQKPNNKCNLNIFKNEECEIDMLLNITKKELSFCVVKEYNNRLFKRKEAKQWNLPNCDKGWRPHIHINASSQIQIARVPIDWYGIKKDNLFKYK